MGKRKHTGRGNPPGKRAKYGRKRVAGRKPRATMYKRRPGRKMIRAGTNKVPSTRIFRYTYADTFTANVTTDSQYNWQLNCIVPVLEQESSSFIKGLLGIQHMCQDYSDYMVVGAKATATIWHNVHVVSQVEVGTNTPKEWAATSTPAILNILTRRELIDNGDLSSGPGAPQVIPYDEWEGLRLQGGVRFKSVLNGKLTKISLPGYSMEKQFPLASFRDKQICQTLDVNNKPFVGNQSYDAATLGASGPNNQVYNTMNVAVAGGYQATQQKTGAIQVKINIKYTVKAWGRGTARNA